MQSERPFGAFVARYLGLVIVLLLVAVPVYIYVEPPWRPLVARLAAAIFLGIALLELRAALAARLWEGGSSPLDEVRRRAAPDPGVPSRLYDLMDDVRAALRSHRYFDEVLWPRLAALTPDPPEQPPSRRFGRGPSLTHLSEAVTAIERRS